MSGNAGRVALKRQAGVCINGPLPGGTQRTGIDHGPIVRNGRCQRCMDVHRANEARRREARRDRCRNAIMRCKNGHELTPQSTLIRIENGYQRRICRTCKMGRLYTPIDEILGMASIRVLRSLRWFDWVEMRDAFDAVEAPDHDCAERNAIAAAISRLIKRGCVEQRKTKLGSGVKRFWRGVMREIRITKQGRAVLEEALSTYERHLDAGKYEDEAEIGVAA